MVRLLVYLHTELTCLKDNGAQTEFCSELNVSIQQLEASYRLLTPMVLIKQIFVMFLVFRDSDGLVVACIKGFYKQDSKVQTPCLSPFTRGWHPSWRPFQKLLSNYTNLRCNDSKVVHSVLCGSLLCGKLFLTPSNSLVRK